MTLDPAGSRLGRRAEQRERRRKQRRRLAVAGVAAAAALLVLVTVVLVRSGGSSGAHPRAPVRTQHTLLLQVKAADGTALGSALLAHDTASASGVVVLVPQQVLVNVPGGGSMPFSKALTTSAVGSRNALADLMGVTIDGSWVLDGTTFSQLVDQVGPLKVTVDVPVLSGRTVLLQPGPQSLNGTAALQFAGYLGVGEQEQTRLTRLQSVLDGLLTSLPAKPAAVIMALGGGSQSSVDPPALAALLEGLKADDAASNLQYRTLPVIPVSTGNDDIRFRIDAPATRSLVDGVLAQSIPPGSRAEGNRVLVLNGVGTPGLGQKVRDKLVPAGFVFVGSRNAPSFGYAKTQVLVPTASTTGAALGARVAKALGVPDSSVQTSDQIGTVADVVVIVGLDFKAQ